MAQVNHDALKRYASKYVWWKTPDEALMMPARGRASDESWRLPGGANASQSSRGRLSAGGPEARGNRPIYPSLLDILALPSWAC